MAKAEFKAPQDVKFKTPDAASSLFGEEPAALQPHLAGPGEGYTKAPDVVFMVETPKIEWSDIPEPTVHYPFNGQPVWLTPDGETEYLAVWRITREFKEGRFQPTAFWAVRNGGGTKIGFEPIGYRRFEEPLFVPKKRT